MVGKLLKIPFVIVADCFTLGGAINDGHFQNGCSYTGKLLKDMAYELELKQIKKELNTYKEMVKELSDCNRRIND